MNIRPNSTGRLLLLSLLVLGLGLMVGFASFELAHHDHDESHAAACWACAAGPIAPALALTVAAVLPARQLRPHLPPVFPPHSGMPRIERRRGPPAPAI